MKSPKSLKHELAVLSEAKIKMKIEILKLYNIAISPNNKIFTSYLAVTADNGQFKKEQPYLMNGKMKLP